MEGVPEKAISWPVTVYNKKLSNQCNLLVQDKKLIILKTIAFQLLRVDIRQWDETNWPHCDWSYRKYSLVIV